MEVKDSYQTSMHTKEEWECLRGVIEQTAKEVLGYQEMNRKTQELKWWSDEIGQLVVEKKKSYQELIQTQDQQDCLVYDQLKVVEKSVIQNKTEICMRKCEEIHRYTGEI